jgi:hypothetical protein
MVRDRLDEFPARLEVIVDVAYGDLGRGGDIGDAGMLETLAVEQGVRLEDQAFPVIDARHVTLRSWPAFRTGGEPG